MHRSLFRFVEHRTSDNPAAVVCLRAERFI
jgi:hypothetical protein